MNVLFIQTAFVGDLVLTIPSIDAVYRKYRGVRIFVLVSKGKKELFDGDNRIYKVIEFDKHGKDAGILGIFRLIKVLNSYNIDLVFNFHRYGRTNIIVSMMKAKYKVGYSFFPFSLFYTKSVSYYFDGTHEVDRLFAVLVAYDKNFSNFYPKKGNKYMFAKQLVFSKFGFKQPYIVISPGTERPIKAWPTNNYVELVKILSKRYTVIITGSKNDTNTYCSKFNDIENVINLCGKTKLDEFVSIVDNAECIVANDSSPVHIASMLAKKGVFIYGPTTKRLGFHPYSKSSLTAELDLKCRPCNLHKIDECKYNRKCLRNITVSMVLRLVETILT